MNLKIRYYHFNGTDYRCISISDDYFKNVIMTCAIPLFDRFCLLQVLMYSLYQIFPSNASKFIRCYHIAVYEIVDRNNSVEYQVLLNIRYSTNSSGYSSRSNSRRLTKYKASLFRVIIFIMFTCMYFQFSVFKPPYLLLTTD